jgi:endonuclease III
MLKFATQVIRFGLKARLLGMATTRQKLSIEPVGYVSTSTPEQSMFALEKKLPQKDWIEINRLLVPFGKHICTGELPRCSTCPVLEMCQQVGVSRYR